MALNFPNLGDRKTEVVVLGGTAGTSPEDVGSLAQQAKQTRTKLTLR